MPILPNPKHEAFAVNLAKGQKQGEAYTRAGYQSNPSAASRLASQPMISDRVAELEKGIMDKMTAVMDVDPDELPSSLADMGLTMEWVAAAYKKIYNNALNDASYAAANSAVANIQKLLEVEKSGKPNQEEDTAPLVKLNDVTSMLTEARKLIELGQREGKAREPEEEELTDVTPAPTTTPAQILATRGISNDDDHER